MGRPLEGIFKVKVSSKGQVVIPKPLREFYFINEGDELVAIPLKEGILIKKAIERKVGLRGLLKGLKVDVSECEEILLKAKISLKKAV